MMISSEKWFINESELSDEQLDVKNLSPKNSYVVSGGAGSGKTVLAIHRAIELISRKEDCIVVVYTSALKKFISAALHYNPFGAIEGGVMTYEKWKRNGFRMVGHLIVDEVQDFTEDEIAHFKKHTTISMALFGDSAQKLYPMKPVTDENGKKIKVKTLSVEEIAEYLALPKRSLTNNHRLPRKIARFAQHLTVTTIPLENQCKKEGEKIPTVFKCKDLKQEVEMIIKTIKSRDLRDVGILVPNNDQVIAVRDILLDAGMPCEIKYSKGDQWENQLEFDTDNPKVMTYFSAKGLQFETVILPDLTMFNNSISFKAPLYVACTRASQELIISYSNSMHSYLQAIPRELFNHIDYKA
jgi:DNA helicase IV